MYNIFKQVYYNFDHNAISSRLQTSCHLIFTTVFSLYTKNCDKYTQLHYPHNTNKCISLSRYFLSVFYLKKKKKKIPESRAIHFLNPREKQERRQQEGFEKESNATGHSDVNKLAGVNALSRAFLNATRHRAESIRQKRLYTGSPSNTGSFFIFRGSKIIMLPQQLRRLLPALIVSWMHLQLGAALPAERSSHVSANIFHPRSVLRVRFLPNETADFRTSTPIACVRARGGVTNLKRRSWRRGLLPAN